MNLDNAYLFQGMGDETRKRILDAAAEESDAQGVFLFHQGDLARNLYILGEGRVRLTTSLKHLLVYVMATERGGAISAYVPSEKGDAIGWSSLVENKVYTASAECLVLGFAGAHVGGFGLTHKDFMTIGERAAVIGDSWRTRLDDLISPLTVSTTCFPWGRTA